MKNNHSSLQNPRDPKIVHQSQHLESSSLTGFGKDGILF